MVDRTKVQRDKHESPTERPREAKIVRHNRPRAQQVDHRGGGGRTAGERTSVTRTSPGANARRAVQARNRPTTRRRPAERLNLPQSRGRTRRDIDDTLDHVRKRADTAPAGMRRAAKLSEEEVTSPDVSLEVSHGPEGEANAGQDLREPRMIGSRGGKDPNARHPKGRAERRAGDEHAAGET